MLRMVKTCLIFTGSRHILLLYGGYLLKKENNVTNAGFRQILSRQSTERGIYQLIGIEPGD